MIRLFVSDIDGTLLNEKSQLEEETVAAVRRFQKLGGLFMLATGRNNWEIDEVTSRIPDTINNCASGCILYDSNGDEIISCFLEKENVEKVLEHRFFNEGITHFHGDQMTYIYQDKQVLHEKGLSFLLKQISPSLGSALLPISLRIRSK